MRPTVHNWRSLSLCSVPCSLSWNVGRFDAQYVPLSWIVMARDVSAAVKPCGAGTAVICDTSQKTISSTFRVHNSLHRLCSFNFRAGFYLKLCGTCLPCDNVRDCVFRKYKFCWKHIAECSPYNDSGVSNTVVLWGLLMYWSW
jgi:hypothetical protein